ncbi:hypothetical protein [Cellulomonas sp. Leaf334]|uniref:hypothetical protein n=1 Tax=Cellulomonas sp. Leaf334 TaxID=1736339 RepID=UPI0006F5B843|nr:hypothetical protein [Cellulomonas sp. Leaf334]KQR12030.1 hypothetical protein ASF78_12665 [Cellulomonas sp. Leaf334]
MDSTTEGVAAPDPNRRRRRKGVAVRFGLAGLALVGIGAAATSAAWTNDAWFNASSSSASVLLDGSAASATGPWTAADTDATGITFAGTTFSLLVPGQTRTATYWIKNSSSTCLNVPAPTITKAEPLAGVTANDAAVTLSTTAIGNMAPGAVQAVTVTVTTPTTWSTTHQSQTSATALKIAYTGTTVAAATSTGACA